MSAFEEVQPILMTLGVFELVEKALQSLMMVDHTTGRD
jgi:hypothetical protein